MIYYGLEAQKILDERGWMPQCYIVLCLRNAKVYVGIVKNEGKTWQQRTYRELTPCYASNEHYRRAMKKYGRVAFHRYLFAVADTVEEICEVEKAQILELRSYLREYGYNKTMGGEGAVLTPNGRKEHKAITDSEEWRKNQLSGTRRGQDAEWLANVRQTCPVNAIKAQEAIKEQKAARRPEWSKTPEGIRALLITVFPEMDTNHIQEKRAARYARFIYFYWEQNLSASQASKRMGLSFTIAKALTRNIANAAKGKTALGKVRGLRPRGRPANKKQTQIIHVSILASLGSII